MRTKKIGAIIVALVVVIVAVVFGALSLNKPDFDFTFSTSMLNCKILGAHITEVTQNSVVAYAKKEGLIYSEADRSYVGEGYFIDERIESEDSVTVRGLDNYAYIESDAITVFQDSSREHHLLKEYADSDISVIQAEFLGQTYEEFFNGLAEGLYEKAKENPDDPYNGEEGHITFNNGYVCNDSTPEDATWGTTELTDNWFIVFEENGREIIVRVCSISNEKIDYIEVDYREH